MSHVDDGLSRAKEKLVFCKCNLLLCVSNVVCVCVYVFVSIVPYVAQCPHYMIEEKLVRNVYVFTV